MSGSIIVGIVWLSAVPLVGLLIGIWAPPPHRGVRRLGRRAVLSMDLVGAQWGRARPVGVLLLASWAVIIIVIWILGELAHALESTVDRPLFAWFQARQVDGWSDAWLQITNIGSPSITGWAAAVGAIGLAILWKLRGLRWWVPGVTIWLGVFAVRYAQFLTKEVVDRGHPPTTLGSWPSGGCARVIVVYGLIMFFVVLCMRNRGRWTWVTWATATAFLASVQGYARTYNLEHWFTDVVGGLIFGVLVLGMMIVAHTLLERPLREVVVDAQEQETQEADALR